MRSAAGSIYLIVVLLWISLLNGCTTFEEQRNKLPDTFDRGTIHVSADESFKPIIDAEVEVYEGSEPNAKIIVHYKPEAECLKDFGNDSIRVIIVTRGFTESEENFMIDSLKV